MAERSAPELETLIQSGEVFDLVYIDGDHTRDAVLVDSLLAWHALRPGGILVWDDYEWGPELPLDQRPKQAIDVFLSLHAGELDTMHRGYQIIVRRVASAA